MCAHVCACEAVYVCSYRGDVKSWVGRKTRKYCLGCALCPLVPCTQSLIGIVARKTTA